MKTIRFSHEYEKMASNTMSAKLLEVLTTTKEELSEEYIKYDTKIKGVEEYYPLPKGKVIILIIQSEKTIFTTVRRWTTEKEKYYRGLRGQEVHIETPDGMLC